MEKLVLFNQVLFENNTLLSMESIQGWHFHYGAEGATVPSKGFQKNKKQKTKTKKGKN